MGQAAALLPGSTAVAAGADAWISAKKIGSSQDWI